MSAITICFCSAKNRGRDNRNIARKRAQPLAGLPFALTARPVELVATRRQSALNAAGKRSSFPELALAEILGAVEALSRLRRGQAVKIEHEQPALQVGEILPRSTVGSRRVALAQVF